MLMVPLIAVTVALTVVMGALHPEPVAPGTYAALGRQTSREPRAGIGPTRTETPLVGVIRAYIEEEWGGGRDLDAIAAGLGHAVQPFGAVAQGAVAPSLWGSDLPILVMAFGASLCQLTGNAIAWADEDGMHVQDLVPGHRDTILITFGPGAYVADALQGQREGAPELGVIYTPNRCGSAPFEVVQLLRLEHGEWRSLWDSALDAGQGRRTSHAQVKWDEPEAADEQRLQGFTIRYSSWLLDDGRNFFHESNPGPHRWFQEAWLRTGDGYVRTGVIIEPSAYATLVEFVYRVAHGDHEGAADLVTERELVARAVAMGLGSARGERPWLLAPYASHGEIRGPLTVAEGPPVRISFVESLEGWLISDLRETDGERARNSKESCQAPLDSAPVRCGRSGFQLRRPQRRHGWPAAGCGAGAQPRFPGIRAQRNAPPPTARDGRRAARPVV